jgi:hypothetical protein
MIPHNSVGSARCTEPTGWSRAKRDTVVRRERERTTPRAGLVHFIRVPGARRYGRLPEDNSPLSRVPSSSMLISYPMRHGAMVSFERSKTIIFLLCGRPKVSVPNTRPNPQDVLCPEAAPSHAKSNGPMPAARYLWTLRLWGLEVGDTHSLGLMREVASPRGWPHRPRLVPYHCLAARRPRSSTRRSSC